MLKREKVIAVLVSVIVASGSVNGVAQTKASKVLRLEAETGQLSGATVMKAGTGFTGTGYVGSFETPGSSVRFHLTASSGIYEVLVRYRAASEKGFDLVVNGKKTSAKFPASGQGFAGYKAGKVSLRNGDNEIAIERGWGYYEIDALELSPAPAILPLKPLKATLSDAKATPKTRQLMQTLLQNYGKKIFSGQQNVNDVAFIRQVTGVAPAILSCDLMDYSPSRVARGTHSETTTENMISEARSGHLLSVMWHWNAPKDLLDKKYKNARGQEVDARWYRGFYTEATTFDLAKALSDPNSEDYRLILSDIDTIAVELKKLQKAEIPVLWRPLHEAEGTWFWWGAKGAEPFKQLWRLLYRRLTETHQLHNLIWVYTSGGKQDWYPGDDVVDIVGTDAYPTDVTDPLSSIWEELLHQFDGRKMLALTEFGGVPDSARMSEFGVRWAYFASWGGNLGPKKVSQEELKRLYHEKQVVNKPVR